MPIKSWMIIERTKKQLGEEAFVWSCCCWSWRPSHHVCRQTQIKRLWVASAGVWPSCLGKMYCPNAAALSLCVTLATV